MCLLFLLRPLLLNFKNASKETIDASDELVEEIRRTLMQTGQKLSRHIKREKRADELERKTQYIRQFVPILVQKLGDITKANKKRKERATKGIMKLLGQDTKEVEEALKTAETRLKDLKAASSGSAVPSVTPTSDVIPAVTSTSDVIPAVTSTSDVIPAKAGTQKRKKERI